MALSFAAQGEILMYDGFPTGEGAYSTKDGEKLKDESVPLTSAQVKGFSQTGWQSSTGVIYSYVDGLALPASFASLDSAAYVGNGAVGSKASGSNDERGMWKTLSDATLAKMKSASELHFRFVMSVSTKSLGVLSVNSSDDYVPNKSAYSAGICLTGSTGYGMVRNSNGQTTRSLGFAVRRVSGPAYKLSLIVLGKDDDHTTDHIRTYDLMDYAGDTPVICYARVKVGGGTDGKDLVEALAQPVAAYDPTKQFQVEASAGLIGGAGTGTPNMLNFALGSYAVGGGPVLFDEFALATTGEEIMALQADGAPSVRAPSIERTETGYAVTATLEDAEATVGALFDDGVTTIPFALGELALGEDGKTAFTVPVADSSLAANKGYQVSVYAENEIGAVTNVVGTVYSGVVSLSKVQDGDEDGLVPAKFAVSIPVASAFDHKISYTLGGTAESGVGYQPLSGLVTIPAGETSAVIEVTPLIDPDDEEKTVSVTLAAGAYDISSTASTATATIASLSLPTEYTVWIATEKSNASDETKWSDGLPLASNPKPALFDGRFSNADVYWDLNPEGADGVLAPLTFTEYTGAFSLNTTVPTTLQQGERTFLTSKLVVGSDKSTVATFDGGTYTVSGLLSCGNNSAADVSLTVTNAAFTCTQTLCGGTSSGDSLHIAAGSTFTGGALTLGGNGGSSGGSRVLVDADAAATFSSMSIATSGNQMVIEGVVTNTGVLNLSSRGNNSQTGSTLTIRKTGQLVQKGTCKVCCWYYGTCRVEDGGQLEAAAIQIGNDSDSGKGGKLIVSNATVTASSIAVCSDDRHQDQYLYLYGDQGETSRITTTGALVLAPDNVACRNGKSNRVYVRGGELVIGGTLRVGTPYETAQGNVFDIGRANSRVTAKSAVFNNDSKLKFTVPSEGFDTVPLQVTDAVVFNHASKLVVDVSNVKGGKHVVLSAGTLPDDILDRVEIVTEKFPAEARIRGGSSVVITVKGGLTVSVR